MSTRCTLLYDENWHLYEECLDHKAIYLELQGTDLEYEVSNGSVSIRIPNEVWKQILLNTNKIQESVERGPIEWADTESLFPVKENKE